LTLEIIRVIIHIWKFTEKHTCDYIQNRRGQKYLYVKK
jgi:hypothetical protein